MVVANACPPSAVLKDPRLKQIPRPRVMAVKAQSARPGNFIGKYVAYEPTKAGCRMPIRDRRRSRALQGTTGEDHQAPIGGKAGIITTRGLSAFQQTRIVWFHALPPYTRVTEHAAHIDLLYLQKAPALFGTAFLSNFRCLTLSWTGARAQRHQCRHYDKLKHSPHPTPPYSVRRNCLQTQPPSSWADE